VAQEESTKIISKLHAILDPFLLRRLKCDVEISLPAKRVFVVYASLTESQIRYNKLIADGTLAESLPGKEERNGKSQVS
jgi:ATP-dependent DNA helicase